MRFCNGLCVYFLGENAHLWVLSIDIHGKSMITLRNAARIEKRGGEKPIRRMDDAPQFCHSGVKFAYLDFKKCKFNL